MRQTRSPTMRLASCTRPARLSGSHKQQTSSGLRSSSIAHKAQSTQSRAASTRSRASSFRFESVNAFELCQPPQQQQQLHTCTISARCVLLPKLIDSNHSQQRESHAANRRANQIGFEARTHARVSSYKCASGSLFTLFQLLRSKLL